MESDSPRDRASGQRRQRGGLAADRACSPDPGAGAGPEPSAARRRRSGTGRASPRGSGTTSCPGAISSAPSRSPSGRSDPRIPGSAFSSTTSGSCLGDAGPRAGAGDPRSRRPGPSGGGLARDPLAHGEPPRAAPRAERQARGGGRRVWGGGDGHPGAGRVPWPASSLGPSTSSLPTGSRCSIPSRASCCACTSATAPRATSSRPWRRSRPRRPCWSRPRWRRPDRRSRTPRRGASPGTWARSAPRRPASSGRSRPSRGRRPASSARSGSRSSRRSSPRRKASTSPRSRPSSRATRATAPSSSSSRPSTPRRSRSSRSACRPGTLAVQYFAAPDALYLFVVAAGGKFQVRTQAVAQKELYDLVRAYRTQLERAATQRLAVGGRRVRGLPPRRGAAQGAHREARRATSWAPSRPSSAPTRT